MLDYQNPNYKQIFAERKNVLDHLLTNPSNIPILIAYYRKNIADFISDWGCTYDPRDTNKGQPSVIPFILFQKQRDWITWIFDIWQKNKDGLTEKSREMGVSWLSVAFAVSVCVLYPGTTVGFGSYKQMYVDTIGDLTSLLQKCRMYTDLLPTFFRAGYLEKTCSKLGLLSYPETKSIIRGEGGDNIGRGSRTSLYMLDESSHIERPERIDAALSQTTRCRIDVSTPMGLANSFAKKRFSGNIPVFTFHWRDDPRKDENWYNEQIRRLDDPVIIAQELDIDYAASHEGTIIKSEWVQAAVDAHIKLDITISGVRRVGFDIADEGRDKNAICARHGILIQKLQEWSGKNSDIFETVQKVFNFCDDNDYSEVFYDADGMDAARGDARKINEERRYKIAFKAFHGSGKVLDPEDFVHPRNHYERRDDRRNKDYFANAKAQSWYALRRRFMLTHRAVTDKNYQFNPDDLISIDSTLKNLNKLISELVQPVFKTTNSGKIMVDKKPDGARSPNYADAVMIAFAPQKREVDWELLKRKLDEIN